MVIQSARCEPPPELLDKDGWHWVKTDKGRTVALMWITGFDGSWTIATAKDLHRWNWRYHAPIPDPPAEPYQSPQATGGAHG